MRVAEATFNTSAGEATAEAFLADGERSDMGEVGMLDEEEKHVQDRIGEALARLGRVKRVGVGVREKVDFVRMWGSRRR